MGAIAISQRRHQIRAKHLKIHRPVKTLELITKPTQTRQPIINIEKSRMTHHRLPPTAKSLLNHSRTEKSRVFRTVQLDTSKNRLFLLR
ncbi:MAG: hypothetical protein PSY12_06380 [bacterium]|nr:hypothetical protein [bacterium]